MHAYLFYRILDTIEDSHAPLEEKGKLFKKVLRLFSKKNPSEKEISGTSRLLLSKLDYTYEKRLLENLHSLAISFGSENPQARKAILKWGREMARGMYRFQKAKIRTLEDQNRYSYYVAGVIGYLFNDLLLINGIISAELKRRLKRYAKNFGLALQKVNILRDIAADIANHRYYWPAALIEKYQLTYDKLCLKENRDAALKILKEQIEDTKKYLYSAMKYILLLPKKALKVRMFCLIPLFMAIESYAKCLDNAALFEAEKVVKISRKKVYEIVSKSSLWGASNEKLVRWFVSTMVQIGPDFVKEEHLRKLALAKAR